MKSKRPAVIISIAAVLVVAVAALCLLTNPKGKGEADAADSAPGVYLRLGMDGVYSLNISYAGTNGSGGGSGGCVNADGSPFKADELIWLDQLDGLEGEVSFAVELYDSEGNLLGAASWRETLSPEERLELDWSGGGPLYPEESSAGEANDFADLSGAELKKAVELANAELARWYELGILSQALVIDEDDAAAFFHEGQDLGEVYGGDYPGRVTPAYYCVRNRSGDIHINMSLDKETGTIFFISLTAYNQDGDAPMTDREPYVAEDGTKYYYYDKFASVIPEALTIDRLCEKLNEYWGFDGYTLSGTYYEPYGYDTEAPDGGSTVKSLADEPFLTVYFDGDIEGVPMYVEVQNFPGSTSISIGTNHAVG